jgi:hypothetical protein
MILMTCWKKHERIGKTLPRVGCDAQIDGKFAHLTAFGDGDIYPFHFVAIYFWYVCS